MLGVSSARANLRLRVPAWRGFATPEVDAGAGAATHGQGIPLPLYANGSQATGEECRWAVCVNSLESANNGTCLRRSDAVRVHLPLAQSRSSCMTRNTNSLEDTRTA